MNFTQSFRLAVKSLLTSKMRALLTMLGIIIGVAAVIIITSLGNGMQNYMNRQFDQLGANLIQVQIWGLGGGMSSRTVDADDMYALVDKYPQYLAGVSPYVSVRSLVRHGSDEYERTSIYGVSEFFYDAQRNQVLSGSKLGEGRFFAKELTDPQKRALAEEVEKLQREYAEGGRPTAVVDETGKPVEYSFTPLTQYQPRCQLIRRESYCALLEAHYAAKDQAERLRQKSRNLGKTVQNLYERAKRKQTARLEEQAATEKADHLRVWGELLQANLYAIHRGEKQVTVENYYDGSTVTIPLDVRLSPSANAQKYFKEYKKKQTAAKMLKKLLADGQREIDYLASVQYEVSQATGEAALAEIRAELKAGGYLKNDHRKEKRSKPADFLRYTSSDGFEILVGRNNAQNDKLTLHTARGKDLWFHVKDAPGSHTVVLSHGQPIPLATQNEAAMLAVFHSSQAASAKVPVDYTEVKNIRKTGDLKPGMVLFEKHETAYVTPDETVLRRLGALKD